MNINTGNIINNNLLGYSIYNNDSSVVDIINNSNNGDIENNTNNGSISYNTSAINSISGLTGSYDSLTRDQLYNDTISSSPVFSIDVTGLTTLDFGSFSQLLKNVILISFNTTESIDTVLNLPINKSIVIDADFGLTVTFEHGTGTNEPRIEGGFNTYISGTYSEWIELEKNKLGVIRQKNIAAYI